MGVKVTCRDCGDVSLNGFNGVKKIQLQHNIDDDTWTYIFRCPVCRMIEVKTPLPGQVDDLLAAGAPCREWRYPAELKDPKRFKSWSSSTRDEMINELLDLHRWLEMAWSHEIYHALIGPVSNTELCQFRADVFRANTEDIMGELKS